MLKYVCVVLAMIALSQPVCARELPNDKMAAQQQIKMEGMDYLAPSMMVMQSLFATLGGDSAKGQTQINDALVLVEKNLKSNPESVIGLSIRAHIKEMQIPGSGKKDYDSAVAIVDANLKQHPDWAFLYMERGDIRETQDRLDEAVADYMHAIELEPANHDIEKWKKKLEKVNKKIKRQHINKQ